MKTLSISLVVLCMLAAAPAVQAQKSTTKPAAKSSSKKTPSSKSSSPKAAAAKAPASNPALDNLAKAAGASYKAKQYPQAIAQYKELIDKKHQPADQDYIMLSRSYYGSGDLQGADDAVSKAIGLTPNSVNAYSLKSTIQVGSEDKKHVIGYARAVNEKLLQLASAKPSLYKKEMIQAVTYLSNDSFKIKDYAKAKTYYQQWSELDPVNAQAKEGLKAVDKAFKDK